MGASPGSSATPPPLCCEHHGDQEEPVKGHGSTHYLSLPSLKQIKEKPIGVHCVVIFYILFASVLLIIALADLMLSINSTVLIKSINFEATERMVGTIILIITAGIACVVVIYSIFAVCKNNSKALHAVSITLGILALVHILLVSFAINLKNEDIQNMNISLANSFLQAQKHNVKTEVKMWNFMQTEFNCCGLSGPEDYGDSEASFLPPNVPYSCCASRKKNETEFIGKWQRDLCILNKTYYSDGCFNAVAYVFMSTTKVTVGVTILLIIMEVLVGGLGLFLSNKKCTKIHEKQIEAPSKE